MCNTTRDVNDTCGGILHAAFHTRCQETQECRCDKEYGGECEIFKFRPFFEGLGVEERLPVGISGFDLWSRRVIDEMGIWSRTSSTMMNISPSASCANSITRTC